MSSSGPPRIHYVTFGAPTPQYHHRVHEQTEAARQLGIFTNIFGFTEYDLKQWPEFWAEHGDFIERNPRGYGYWIWKPYIIKKILEDPMTRDGDILLYSDVGCHFTRPIYQMLPWYIHIMNFSRHYGVLCFNTFIPEKDFTKMDAFNYFPQYEIEHPRNIYQIHTTYHFWKKNADSLSFVNEWYDIMRRNYHLIDDSPSIAPNFPSFIENRHDQTIFSLLAKTRGAHIIPENEHFLQGTRDRGVGKTTPVPNPSRFFLNLK